MVLVDEWSWSCFKKFFYLSVGNRKWTTVLCWSLISNSITWFPPLLLSELLRISTGQHVCWGESVECTGQSQFVREVSLRGIPSIILWPIVGFSPNLGTTVCRVVSHYRRFLKASTQPVGKGYLSSSEIDRGRKESPWEVGAEALNVAPLDFQSIQRPILVIQFIHVLEHTLNLICWKLIL